MENRVKADLHNHLGRYGTFESSNRVVDIASEKLGENGILGIVNCDDFRYERFVDSLKYERIELGFRGNAVYIQEKKILVIKGQEIFGEAHVLVLGLPSRKNIQREKLEDVLKEATDLGAARIAAHPGYNKGIMFVKNWQELLHYFDSWEVYNSEAEFWIPGVSPRDANAKSINFYLREIKDNDNYDVGACSFSDGHGEEQIAISYTWLPAPDMTNSETLNLSLRGGLRETKDFRYLVMRPAKLAALKHRVEIKVINKIFPVKFK